MHFDEGLSARVKGGDSTKGVRGKRASEKLSEEGLVKFSARVSIQVSHLQGDRYFLFAVIWKQLLRDARSL